MTETKPWVGTGCNMLSPEQEERRVKDREAKRVVTETSLAPIHGDGPKPWEGTEYAAKND